MRFPPFSSLCALVTKLSEIFMLAWWRYVEQQQHIENHFNIIWTYACIHLCQCSEHLLLWSLYLLAPIPIPTNSTLIMLSLRATCAIRLETLSALITVLDTKIISPFLLCVCSSSASCKKKTWNVLSCRPFPHISKLCARFKVCTTWSRLGVMVSQCAIVKSWLYLVPCMLYDRSWSVWLCFLYVEGVWGLDDYHCLIYVWGASQLLHHPDITPRDIHDPMLVRSNASEFMYLEGIQTIQRIKNTAPFHETSPMLHSVSELGEWSSVKKGMHKLYLGEVSDNYSFLSTFSSIILYSNDFWCNIRWYYKSFYETGAGQVTRGATYCVRAPLPCNMDTLCARISRGRWTCCDCASIQQFAGIEIWQ